MLSSLGPNSKRAKLANDVPEIRSNQIVKHDEIGRGTFGTVYKGQVDGKICALKMFHFEDWESEGRKLVKEVNINSQIGKHENIASMIGLCFKPFCLVLEYCVFDFNVFVDGSHDFPVVTTLRKFLDFVNTFNFIHFELFPVKVVEDLISGISFLHNKNVAHRDIKPENVLVSNVHYSSIQDKDQQKDLIKTSPIICKLSDFGESRSELNQTRTALKTKTSNIEVGTLSYMAPETYQASGVTSMSKVDLIRTDLWSLGMTIYSVCSPDIAFPFAIENADWTNAIDKLFEKKLLLEKALPSMSTEYDVARWKYWSSAVIMYYKLCRFVPKDRTSLEKILLTKFQLFQLECSQETSVLRLSENFINNVSNNENVDDNGLNSCTFLCMKFGQMLENIESRRIDGSTDKQIDVMKDRRIDASTDRRIDRLDMLTNAAEDIIRQYPVLINPHRDVGRCYDAIEAKAIMNEHDPEFGRYSVRELLPLQAPYSYTLFSNKSFESFVEAVMNMSELSASDKRPVMGIYNASNFSFGVYVIGDSFIVLDSHPVPETSSGNRNGCLLVTEDTRFESALEVCAWLFRRLAYALSPGEQHHSLSLLVKDGEDIEFRRVEGSTDRQIGRSTDQQIDESTRLPIDRSTNRQIDGSADRQIDGSTYALNDNENQCQGSNPVTKPSDQSDPILLTSACIPPTDVDLDTLVSHASDADVSGISATTISNDSNESSEDVVDITITDLNTSSRTPVYSPDRIKFRERAKICIGGLVEHEKVCSLVPQNIMASGSYVIDLKKVDLRDITVDGFVYKSHSSPKQYVCAQFEMGSMVKCMQVRQEKENHTHIMKTQHSTAISDADDSAVLKRIITKFSDRSGESCRYATVEYTFLRGGQQTNNPQPHLFRRAHKNAKKNIQTHHRTFPTVIDTIKEHAEKAPKQIALVVNKRAGDSFTISSPSEVVRDRMQVYNSLRNVSRSKSRNTGVNKTPDYQKLQVMLLSGAVVKQVSYAEKDGAVKPLVYCGTENNHKIAAEFAQVSNPKSPAGVDMTYKCGQFYVTPVTMKNPLLVHKGTLRNPGFVVSLAITPNKEIDDYRFLASNLKRYLGVNLVYGTDGEMALEKGLEDIFPIENVAANKTSIHLRCFTHVKGNIEDHLKSYLPMDEVLKISTRLLGMEHDGVRVSGLVDCPDVETFRKKYQQLKCSFPPAFVQFLESTRFRHRSLVEAMEKCMLKPVRVAAGLGNPPNKFVNNLNEALNLVIQEASNKNSVDIVTFIENVKDNIFDAQREESIRAIYGMGEYRLSELGLQRMGDSGPITPFRWTKEMNVAQRQAVCDKIFKNSDATQASAALMMPSNDVKLSVPLERCSLMSRFPLSSIKELWGNAEFVLGNGKIDKLLSGDQYCVQGFDEAGVVSRLDGKTGLMLRCNCTKFQNLDGICHHVVAVAESEHQLSDLISRYNIYAGNINKMIQAGVPKKAGDKSHNKKPRKGKNNVLQMPVINVISDDDAELDYEKPQRLTKYWHNNERFYVQHIKDEDSMRASQCINCGNCFPKMNPAVGDDLIISHKERYEYPLKDNEGKCTGQTAVTKTKLGRKFYCVKKRCVLDRHPFFWKGMLFIKKSTYEKLTPKHFTFLQQRLHFDPTKIED